MRPKIDANSAECFFTYLFLTQNEYNLLRYCGALFCKMFADSEIAVSISITLEVLYTNENYILCYIKTVPLMILLIVATIMTQIVSDLYLLFLPRQLANFLVWYLVYV